MKPLVSVITPTYNRANLLIYGTQSLMNQSYENWEQVIIDDASEDDTDRILNSAADPRIRHFRNKTNVGVSESYHRGIKKSKGDIIIFQDSDDVSLPDRLEKVVEFLEKNPKVDVCYHELYHVSKHYTADIEVIVYRPIADFDIKKQMKEQMVSGGAVCMRRKAALAYKPHKKAKYNWDWYFTTQLAFKGFKFAPLRVGLYMYRRHNDSLAVKYSSDGRREQSNAFIRNYIKSAKKLGYDVRPHISNNWLPK